MTEALFDLPTHIRRRLVGALDSKMLRAPYTVSAVRSVLGLHEGGEDLVDALSELGRMGISGEASAAWIRTIEVATSRVPRPDLVWSGPEVPGLHARDTRRVYEELLGSAERSAWACSYAYFDGPRAFEVLAKRMDSTPALRVTLLLNIQRREYLKNSMSRVRDNQWDLSHGKKETKNEAHRDYLENYYARQMEELENRYYEATHETCSGGA